MNAPTARRVSRRHVLSTLGAATAGSMIWTGSRAAAADIVIGQSAQMSGPLAATMGPVFKGQDLAIGEINARGGVGGRKVRLISYDDQFDAKRCVENCTKLIEQDKVTALYGLANTAGIAAAFPLLAQSKVPLIGVYAGSPALRAKQHPYFFTTMASYRDEVVQMVRTLVTLQQSRIGLLFQNAPFGQLMQPVVEGVIKELGATLVVKAALDNDGKNAVTAAQALADEQPQAVLFMGFGPAMIPFVKAARKIVGVPVYCVSISNSQKLLQALGPDARGLAFTQVIPFPWRQTTALARNFNQSMEAAKLTVDYDHYFGYVSMHVLLEGLRRAGPRVDSPSLVTAMEGMRNVDIGGYVVDYAPTNHHGSKFVEISMVGEGGKYIR